MINRNDYVNKFKRDNYKRIALEVKKSDYEKIKDHADSRHETVNGFIKRAINETIDHDTQQS